MPTADRKVTFDKNYPYDRDLGGEENQTQIKAGVGLLSNQNETAEATTVSSSGKISKSTQSASVESTGS